MIINNKEEIKKIITTNNININVSDIFCYAFLYTNLFNEQIIKNQKDEKKAIIDQLCEFCEIDTYDSNNQIIIQKYFYQNIIKLDEKQYINNPYVQAINKEGSYKQYALKKLEYEPYQLFAYDEIIVNQDYEEFSRVGYFNHTFSYLALTQKSNVWMSLNPNEIETMKPYIEKGKGDVVILGLGMGYIAFMLSLKEEVKSITVVEKDQNIIDLFNRFVLPYFPHAHKLRIIHNDAFDYLKTNDINNNYVFADLWHSAEDGLPLFIKLKKVNKNIDCWLEKSLYASLRRCMIFLLEECLDDKSEKCYTKEKNYTDHLINVFYQKTKNYTINNKEDLDKLLDDQFLLKLAIE